MNRPSLKRVFGLDGLDEPYRKMNPTDRRVIRTQAWGFLAVFAALVLGGLSIYYAATRQPTPKDTVAGIIDNPTVIRELAAAIRGAPQVLPAGVHRFQCHTAGRAEGQRAPGRSDFAFVFLCYVPPDPGTVESDGIE